MNCQQGDLAIVMDDPKMSSDGLGRNSGKIVRCLKLHPKFKFDRMEPCTVWETDTEFYAGHERHNLMPDYRLKPIRDPGDDAIDETIRRLGTPMDMRLRELENELAKLNESLDKLEKVLTR